MKKSILSLAIVALLFAGCSDKKNNEHSHDGEAHEHTTGTHEHEDGSTHEHHQEEFKVENDSTSINNE